MTLGDNTENESDITVHFSCDDDDVTGGENRMSLTGEEGKCDEEEESVEEQLLMKSGKRVRVDEVEIVREENDNNSVEGSSAVGDNNVLTTRASPLAGPGKYRSRANASHFVGTFSHQPLPFRDYKRGFTACDDFNGFFSSYGWKYVRRGSRKHAVEGTNENETPCGWHLVLDTVYFESALFNTWTLYNAIYGANTDADLDTFPVFCQNLVDEILHVLRSTPVSSSSSSSTTPKRRKRNQ